MGDKKEDEPEPVDPEVLELQNQLGKDKYDRLKEKAKELRGKFKTRQVRWKDKLLQPPTPTTQQLKELEDEVEENLRTKVLIQDDFTEKDPYEGISKIRRFFYSILPPAIHPQSKLMDYWYNTILVLFLYNAWAVLLRVSFTIYQTPSNSLYWFIADSISDVFYVLDLILIKPRLMFLDENGIYESERKLCIKNYIKNGDFRADLLSTIPFDVLYLFWGFHGTSTIVRINRLGKKYVFARAFDRMDASSSNPIVIRLFRTVNIMMWLIHLNACAYYAFSSWEGIGSNRFVYSGTGIAYMRCFYFATKTAMSIGKNPKPLIDNPVEISFMAMSWLMGVFVFAILIGNVKDIIAQSTKNQDEYMAMFDAVSQYMFGMHIPMTTMTRVKNWCQFTWNSQKSFDERAILEFLPGKMRTDVALNIHFKTISGVKLFQGCNPGLLKMIVLKLKPIIFLPGDYVCKKGDVGMEMFIVSSGAVKVVGGPNDSICFVTLGVGVCFGEIALLGTGNMNKRTASIKTHGFTTLFVLMKSDLQQALRDYPEDRNLLSKKAAKAKKEAAAKQAATKAKNMKSEEVIFPTSNEPALLTTVMKVIPAQSKATKYLTEKGHLKEIRESDETLVVETEVKPAKK